MRNKMKRHVLPLLLTACALAACSRTVPVNTELAQPVVDAKLIGVIAPKTLAQTHNDLTVGCEVLDRDYADYHAYKEYLSELGIRKIRLQAGWAKTEKEKGVYDFAWLDSIIDDAVARGLEPWLQTSYGNELYEGGGSRYLGAAIPTSEEALDAWYKWVHAMAVRYKGKVHEWEIWNEPDDFMAKHPEEVVAFTIHTAEVIKEVDPEAKIAAFALAFWRPDDFKDAMTRIQKAGKLDLFEWISYHWYRYRPEDMYGWVRAMQDTLDRLGIKTLIRQGETGAPSKGHMGGSLTNYDWSEISQSKWALRRMLSDRGRDIPTTIYGMSDMNYRQDDAIKRKNVKGLLESDDNNQIVRRKQSFFGVRNLVAVWELLGDHTPSDMISVEGEGSYSVYPYVDAQGYHSFVVWDDAKAPVDAVEAPLRTVTVKNGKFRKPVCVDIRTGNVYAIKAKKTGTDWVLSVPIYDSPVYVVDKSSLILK